MVAAECSCSIYQQGALFCKKKVRAVVGNGCNLHFARAQFDDFFLQQMVNDYYCCTLENQQAIFLWKLASHKTYKNKINFLECKIVSVWLWTFSRVGQNQLAPRKLVCFMKRHNAQKKMFEQKVSFEIYSTFIHMYYVVVIYSCTFYL